MKAFKSILLLSGLFATSVFAEQYDYNLCMEYGPAYTNGTANEIHTPMFVTTGNSWVGQYLITNVSNGPVTVKLEFSTPQGQNYTPYSVVYNTADMFSASNTPLSAQGAILQPGEMGTVVIKDPNTKFVNVGKLSWSSPLCQENAIVAAFRNQYNATSKISNDFHYFNDGQPF